ncbi:MAG TPA: BTAD domain-containing putative transcriptional regulator [Ktedonobacteraceae bacterium]|jgi:predicted ATPase/DNA-binding SARP family transcriptional activator
MQEKLFVSGSLWPDPACTSFIGRRQEARAIAELLTTGRLLTLTGAPGCGKSRLALQVANGLARRFAHGAFWVELATLSNPAGLLHAIGNTLAPDVPPASVSPAALVAALQPGESLLVLNNCEQLVAACSPLIEQLLRACPHLRVLVTSRETLNLAGETIWVVPPLSFPPPGQPYALAELQQFEAVQLFVERARAVQPAFELTPVSTRAIVQICQRLDGIPLAIEMAAARLRVLAVEQIAARLDDCCRLLTVGYRTALPQHQSLNAALDWSYIRLPGGERRLLLRLSAFADGASLEVIEQAYAGEEGAGPQAILDALTGLVSKSLVVVERRGGQLHYHLLDMLRQYVHRRQREAEKCEQVGPQLLPLCARIQPLRLLGFGCARILSDLPPDWRYAKARELLFYLLCSPARSKEQIGLALWPDASPGQLRRSFHTALHHLRRVLGRAEWILFTHERYCFNRGLDYWFDVETFEAHLDQARQLQAAEPLGAISHLQEGLKLYQGDFLEGAAMGDWYLPRQRQLKTCYQHALLTLGQLFFASGQYPRAAETYHRLIEHDSLQEVAHRELMRCHARQGERSQALRHYQVLANLLHRELQACPAPETADLFERLRNGEAI